MIRLPKRVLPPFPSFFPARLFARNAAGRKPGEPEAGELAWASGLFFSSVPLERWNPDDLLWRKGADVYRKMMHDDQLRALVALKQAVVTARGWHFEPQNDSPEQTRCAAFFRFLLVQHLEGTFSQALRGIMSSQVHGFSLTEKIYETIEWQGESMWGLRCLKLRPPDTFVFETDVHGNLTGIVQEQAGRRISLSPERFIHHVNKPEADPQYGESDLRECYRHWWAKDNNLLFTLDTSDSESLYVVRIVNGSQPIDRRMRPYADRWRGTLRLESAGNGALDF
ncbi:MAG: DUF935 family protein [SAR324 cluster bacterium]|nr:DUF935 family protein [SAR324 cluster bacterium]